MDKKFKFSTWKISFTLSIFIILAFAVPTIAQNCVNFSGAAIYTQDFDGLGQSPAPQNSDASNIFNISATAPAVPSRFLGKFDNAVADNGGIVNIPGWALVEEGQVSGQVSGRYNTGNGSAAGDNTYSFGSNGSGERALGSLTEIADSTNYLGGCFTYTGVTTVTSVKIAYTGELWRYGGSLLADPLTFQYAVNATNIFQGTYIANPTFDFVRPITSLGLAGARDGNAAANQTITPYTTLNVTLNTNDRLYVRWVDNNIAGNDDGLAIDDFGLALPALGAHVRVGGRVIDSNNQGISNTTIRMTLPDGTVRVARSSSFGYYSFNEVEVGETYVLSASHRRYQFSNATQVVSVNDNKDDLNFIVVQ